MQKPFLSSKTIIEYLKSRVQKEAQDPKIVVISKASSLPDEWRKEFLDDPETEILEM